MASVLLCIYCEDQIDNFENHISAGYNIIKKSKCNDCDLSIANMPCLESHKTVVHKKSQRVYTCERCNIDFSTKRYLLVHKDIGHESKKIDIEVKEEVVFEECETKPLEIKSENEFSHYENIEYYTQETEIKDEQSFESDEPNYELDLTCHICEKTYKNIQELKDHYNRKHQEGKKVVVSIDQDDKNLKCEKCDKTFTRKDNKKSHIDTVHSNIRKYKCDQCEKAFKMSSSLKAHKACLHSTLRNFKCKECSSTFKLNTQLTQHVKTVHQNLRNYRCSQCNKTFKQSSSQDQKIQM